MNQRESVNRAAVARWRRRALGREIVEEFDEQLRKAMEDRLPPEDDFDAVPDAPPPAETAPAPPPTKAHKGKRKTKTHEPGKRVTLEEDWRRTAQAEGLSAQESQESWVWFHRKVLETPPVLEETEERTARETTPDSVRRVLTRKPVYRFVGYDDELLDELEPILDDLPMDAEARRFFQDVAYAQETDAPNTDTRRALDRLAGDVKLRPERMRQLVEHTRATMTATQKPPTKPEMKRRLIQKAVLSSVAAAERPTRIGQQRAPSEMKDDLGHPITLEDIFGTDGVQKILPYVSNPESTDIQDTFEGARRKRLIASLGGRFRPAHLTDRAICHNWLKKEIALRTVALLSEDLDVPDAGRRGGSRRKEEPLDGMWYAQVGPDTQAFTDTEMLANGEPGDQETTFGRATNRHTQRSRAWEKKSRIENALLARVDFERELKRIRRDSKKAAQRQQYIDLLLREPECFDNNARAAQELHWPDSKVRDIKREVCDQGERRWKSQ
jgi:hypothetical protein